MIDKVSTPHVIEIIIAIYIFICVFVATLRMSIELYKKRIKRKKHIDDLKSRDSKYIMYFLKKIPPPRSTLEKPSIDLAGIVPPYKEPPPKTPTMDEEDIKLYSDEFNRTPLYTKDLDKKEEKPKPSEIKQHLDQYIVGQEKAKRVLSVSVYNHYKRMEYNHFAEIPIKKSNVLLVGPTGSGKTLLAGTIARELKVPFFSMDVSSVTAAGYIGRKVEEVVDGLVLAASKMEDAKKGIIFLDEVDKLASREGQYHAVHSTRVQQELLKILEGIKATTTRYKDVDISEVLFILGGAFSGLSEIVENRISTTSIGFHAKVEKDTEDALLLSHLQVEDLVKYGLIPELLGRVSTVAVLEKLTEAELVRILTEPKDSIVKEYQALVSCDKCELEFTNGALKAIARQAMKNNTGARGLRAIIDKVLLDSLYSLPDNPLVKKITITKDIVEKKLK